MTKGNLAATSLVAAIPAGALAYFTVMAFLNYADKMATMLQVVTGTALLFSVLMALSPLAILIFMRGPAKPTDEAASPAAGAVAGTLAAREPDEVAAAPAGSDMAVDVLAADELESHEAADDMSLSGFDESAPPAPADDEFNFDDDDFQFDEDDSK